MTKHLVILMALVVSGCGFVPEKVQVRDRRLKSMWEAAREFDRQAYGFSPLPTDGYVRLESHPRQDYDAMIHICSKTSRTISFRRTAAGYRWVSEQESFQGPKQYKTVDDTFFETIVLSYNGGWGSGLHVSYQGEDSRLSNHYELTLFEVKPILKEWGY